MSTLYPVAASVDEALQGPRGLAAREREAQDLAGAPVTFVAEAVGPAFATREALAEAFDPRRAQPWSSLRPVSETGKGRAAVSPVNRDGRRWPEPKSTAPVLWRLSVSYWKIRGADAAPAGIMRGVFEEIPTQESWTQRLCVRSPTSRCAR